MIKLQRPSSMTMGPCTETAAYVSDLMMSGVSIHQLHLKVSAEGSYAAHKALGEYYEGITGLADAIAEQYQGAREKILDFPMGAYTKLTSVDQAIVMLRELTQKTNTLQAIMPFSEVVNQLDEVKSLIAATKYKLLFLK